MRYRRFEAWYTTTAKLFLTGCLTIGVLNVVLYVYFTIRDKRVNETNIITRSFGSERVQRAYPDLDASTINQLLKETWSRSRVYEPYTEFREGEFKGRFVNVSPAGFRTSKNQGPWPPRFGAYNVFLFGGSTTFSYGLADDHTVAFSLQEELAKISLGQVYVYNFGRSAYHSTQERILFQELLVEGLRPNMAIFIDGLNDFVFRDGSEFSNELREVFRTRGSPSQAVILGRWLASWPMARLAMGLRWRWMSAQPSPAETINLLDSVVRRYLSNKIQIESIAKAFRVVPVFVWQPMPYYKYDLRHHLFPDDPGGSRYARSGYERIREIVEAQNPGRNFFWCADMQEHLKKPLYVDHVHYNAEMSRLLAERIADLLAERRILPDGRR